MDELSEQGQKDFEAVIQRLKKEFAVLAENCIRDLYCDLPKYLETDAWLNYRQTIRDALASEARADIPKADQVWARHVRQVILKEHREELVTSLNADLLLQVEHLKSLVEWEQQRSRF